jgi:putative membrane protein
MMHDTMSGWMNASMVLWFVFAIVLIALAVAALVWLIQNIAGRDGGRGSRRQAREELDLRYARGELSRDEYQQRRADLSG